MEENKAPEKIYVHEASAPELTEKLPYHIEYIRTDAVIDFLKDCSTYEDFNGNTCVDEDLFNTMVEDFVNYMKGE